MIEIRINVETAVEARSIMAELLGTTAAAPSAAVTVTETKTDSVVEQTKLTAAQKKAAKKAEEEAAAAARQISSGAEERVDPAVEAQDTADESAETAAAKADQPKLTHDDVRGALGAYVKAFGMPAAQEDGPKVLALIFGEGKAKVSDIPDTQEALGKAVTGIKEMLEKNPYKREAVKAA